MPKPHNGQKKMVQFSNRTKLSQVRKKWYNTQTVPKPANSHKNMVQYSNRAKPFHQSGKYGTILKQGQNLSTNREKMVQYRNSAKTCHQPKTNGTKLKQSQNLSAVRKRSYNTQTKPKPVDSQKKMVQF